MTQRIGYLSFVLSMLLVLLFFGVFPYLGNNLCIFAQKSKFESKYYEKKIPSLHFTIDNKVNNIDYFSDIELKEERINHLIPYSVEIKGEKRYTKKWENC